MDLKVFSTSNAHNFRGPMFICIYQNECPDGGSCHASILPSKEHATTQLSRITDQLVGFKARESLAFLAS